MYSTQDACPRLVKIIPSASGRVELVTRRNKKKTSTCFWFEDPRPGGYATRSCGYEILADARQYCVHWPP